MTTSAPGALAVELRPASATQWVAHLLPHGGHPRGPLGRGHLESAPAPDARHVRPTGAGTVAGGVQLRPRSPLLRRPSGWATQLAAGYTAALAIHDTEAAEEPLSVQEAQLLRKGTLLVPAGQLSEWVLDDLQDETSDIRG